MQDADSQWDELTGVCVLEGILRSIECSIDDREETVVEALCAIEQIEIFLAAKVVVRADSRSIAPTGGLQPAVVLADTSSLQGIDWDILIAINRCRNISAVPQRLSCNSIADGWIKSLQKAQGTVLQNSIIWRRDGNLALLDDVGVHAVDSKSRVRGDVATPVVLARSVNLGLTQDGEICWSQSFWRTIAVSRIDVYTKDILIGTSTLSKCCWYKHCSSSQGSEHVVEWGL